jgi:hypothetical protein
MMHPNAHKSAAGPTSVYRPCSISGDTYCAVPTKLLHLSLPPEDGACAGAESLSSLGSEATKKDEKL